MDINTLPAKDKAEVVKVRRRIKRQEIYEENARLKAENEMLRAQIQDLIDFQKQIVPAWLECLRQAGRI